MSARTRAHILIIKTSHHFCESGLCGPHALLCLGHSELEWDVRCPYGDREYNVPGRDCTTWTECRCLLSDEDRDELYDSEEEGGPCPTSPTGRHHFIHNPDIFPGSPTTTCWAYVCPCNSEHAEDFAKDHGDGVWAVLIGHQDECDDGLTFVPLAKLED